MNRHVSFGDNVIDVLIRDISTEIQSTGSIRIKDLNRIFSLLDNKIGVFLLITSRLLLLFEPGINSNLFVMELSVCIFRE